MSGTNSSQRQWTTKHVRVLAAVLLALSMLIATGVVAFAQDGIGARASQLGVFCVKGSVIDHDEMGLKDFEVTANGPAGEHFSDLSDSNGYFDFLNLSQGQWTFAITLKDAYTMVVPYVQSLTVTMDYGKTDCTKIRFKIAQKVPVIVTKIDENHNLLDDWLITAAPGKNNWFAYPSTEKTGDTDSKKQFATGTAVFNLTTGDWIFSEAPPAQTKDVPDPIHFRPIVPNTGTQGLKVVCTLDGTGNACVPVEVRFKNLIKNACIDAFKFDRFVSTGEVPITTTTGLANWKITVKRIDNTVVASGLTDATGRVRFINLLPGKYKVVEEVQPGWVVDPIDPAYQTVYIVDVSNGSDNCSEVQFQNIQQNQFCIEGIKFDSFGGVGLPGWQVSATPLKKGGFPAVGVDPTFRTASPVNSDFADLGIYDGKIVTQTNDLGKFKFVFPENDYRIPGAGYKICEQTQDGWLAHNPLCETVYLPKRPGACAVAKSFENQQVGHWDTVIAGKNAPSPNSMLPGTPGIVNAGQGGYGHDGGGWGHGSSGAGCSTTYSVQAGDSLYGIGAMYGVSAHAMLAANPWVYGRPNYYVFTGDTVCIP